MLVECSGLANRDFKKPFRGMLLRRFASSRENFTKPFKEKCSVSRRVPKKFTKPLLLRLDLSQENFRSRPEEC